MALKKRFEEGLFCWADLATTDAELAKVFYSELFHWKAEAIPTDRGVPYIIFKKGEHKVCAMYEMDAEKKTSGLSAHWLSYIAVNSVDVTVSGAKNLGATILVPPMEVMGYGRMAILQDPEGAVFALWQGSEDSPTLYRENNSVGWNELYVHDTASAAEFYADLLKWESATATTDDGIDYTEFHLGTEAVGGMLQIQSDWGDIPPHWSIYFQVADLDEKMQRLEGLGGTLATPKMNAENVGEFVVAQDPQGAHFLMIELYNKEA